MSTFYDEIKIKTDERNYWYDITSQISQCVVMSGLSTGIVTVSSLHTTAGITINENADPDVGRDIFKKLGNLIPQQDHYDHAEGNSDSHLKATLTGLSATIPIHKNTLVLGTWQSIYFCEFDGPRSRLVSVTIIGE